MRLISGLRNIATSSDSQKNFFYTSDLMREELWKVDRCGVDHEYKVRYYREPCGDGFSNIVVPQSFQDKLAWIKFTIF